MEALVQRIISDTSDEFSKDIAIFEKNVCLNVSKIFVKS